MLCTDALWETANCTLETISSLFTGTLACPLGVTVTSKVTVTETPIPEHRQQCLYHKFILYAINKLWPKMALQLQIIF